MAYYTVSDPVSIIALRDHVARRLPDFMVPTAWVLLPEFPLTPNGKLNRQALPAPGSEASTGTVPYAPPVTATERELVRIWSELLQIDPSQVGTAHDFFALGGHSLLVVQAMNRVRDAFGVSLSVAQLFERTTIATVAASIDDEQILQAGGDELSRFLDSVEARLQEPQ